MHKGLETCLRPDIPEPYEGLGMAYLSAGQLDRAEDALERAEEFITLPFITKVGVGRILEKMRDIVAEMATWA